MKAMEKAFVALAKIKEKQWKTMESAMKSATEFVSNAAELDEIFQGMKDHVEDGIDYALSPVTSAFDSMVHEVIGAFDPLWEGIRVGMEAVVNHFNVNLQELQRLSHESTSRLMELKSRMKSMETWEEMKKTDVYQEQYADYMWEVEAKKRGTRGNLEW